ncbi:MAG: respiratory nitrate reductase subunit gamma [Bacillota bacterium]
MVNLWDLLLWVVFPYVSIAVFVVAHLYRYATNPYGWTSRSSEFLEKGWLRWGSLLFHWGVIFALLGHVGGLGVPMSWVEALGVSPELYHLLAIVIGGTAGVAAVAGLVILLLRRTLTERLRLTSTRMDFLALALLLVVVGLGIGNTLGYNLLYGSYEYRVTMGPWLRGLLTLRPDASLMVDVPITFQLHALAAFGLAGVWPFTRLVHVWSVPLTYVGRTPILVRAYAQKTAGGR